MSKNNQSFLAQKIRSQYIEKTSTELDELKALDEKVKRPPTVIAYIVGVIAAIIMGAGMSIVMTEIGTVVGLANTMAIGIVVGVIGMLLAALNYPIYQQFLAARKRKYAAQILEKSEKILSQDQ